MARFLGWVGRVLVTSGTLLLLFVAYQLWGTGIYQSRQQDSLRSSFEQSLRHAPATTRPTTTVPTTTSAAPTPVTSLEPLVAPAHGDALGRIQIPKLGVDQIVVEGIDVADLRKGPGHYPNTQMPGHEGNSAIAGHRTTYGAPFGDLDKLAKDDTITITTAQGRFDYHVTDVLIVDPGNGDVLQPTPYSDAAHVGHDKATLTLTTCNPKYSAAQRLVVKAEIVLPAGQPLPLPKQEVPKTARAGHINGLSGERGSRRPTVVWALIVIVVGALWWWAFHRRPRFTTWVAGAIPFLVALYICYSYLERLLPANY